MLAANAAAIPISETPPIWRRFPPERDRFEHHDGNPEQSQKDLGKKTQVLYRMRLKITEHRKPPLLAQARAVC